MDAPASSPLPPDPLPASYAIDLSPPPDAPAARTSALRAVLGALGGAAVGATLAIAGIETADALGIEWRALFPKEAGLGRWVIGGSLLLLAFWLQVLVHEAGHALAGLAGGLRPLAFGVGPLRLERSGEGWRFRWGGGLSGISGFALLLPSPGHPPSRAAQAVYLLGGVVANAIVAFLALWALSLSPPDGLRGLLVALVATGLFLAVVNLVPFRSQGWLSDGAGLWSLWRQPGLAFASIALQQAVQASVDGTRPRDWPAELLPREDAPFGEFAEPAFDIAVASMRLSRAIDAGDHPQAEAAARYLHGLWPTAAPALRPGLAAMLAVHCLLVRNDLATLRAWRERMSGSLLDMSCHEAWLDAEIALADGDVGAARQSHADALAALPRIHDAGTRIVVAERLDALAARLASASP